MDIDDIFGSDLAKEQADLLTLMEASMDPQILAAVENAYHANDEASLNPSVEVSCWGTSHAKSI